MRELERTGRLTASQGGPQQQTLDEMARLMRDFRRQGLNPQQAHDQAWELVRERYILIPPEAPAS